MRRATQVVVTSARVSSTAHTTTRPSSADAGSCRHSPSTTAALKAVNTTWVARRMGFSKEDEITLVFCGSKKSLASGVPMAKVLFASHAVGAIVLPIMVFHQMQLMVCAVLAQRYARRSA